MERNVQLIRDLINQAEGITYHNNHRDSVEKRAEMLIRKIFGNDSHYLQKLSEISYSPSIWMSTTPQSVFERSFNFGKSELLNLLNVVLEDLLIDTSINIKTKTENMININSKNVFIVHGHNDEMKLDVARTVEKLKLNPIILHEQASRGKTIIEKFTDNSDVIFAIILLSADDIAYARSESPEAAKFRARQNVIFELGYFIGKLGRDRVLPLVQTESKFETPSDYDGVVYVSYDKSGKWKFDLVKELKELGLPVDANNIL